MDTLTQLQKELQTLSNLVIIGWGVRILMIAVMVWLVNYAIRKHREVKYLFLLHSAHHWAIQRTLENGERDKYIRIYNEMIEDAEKRESYVGKVKFQVPKIGIK